MHAQSQKQGACVPINVLMCEADGVVHKGLSTPLPLNGGK